MFYLSLSSIEITGNLYVLVIYMNFNISKFIAIDNKIISQFFNDAVQSQRSCTMIGIWHARSLKVIQKWSVFWSLYYSCNIFSLSRSLKGAWGTKRLHESFFVFILEWGNFSISSLVSIFKSILLKYIYGWSSSIWFSVCNHSLYPSNFLIIGLIWDLETLLIFL